MQSAVLIFIRQHDRNDWLTSIAGANHQFQANLFSLR